MLEREARWLGCGAVGSFAPSLLVPFPNVFLCILTSLTRAARASSRLSRTVCAGRVDVRVWGVRVCLVSAFTYGILRIEYTVGSVQSICTLRSNNSTLCYNKRERKGKTRNKASYGQLPFFLALFRIKKTRSGLSPQSYLHPPYLSTPVVLGVCVCVCTITKNQGKEPKKSRIA